MEALKTHPKIVIATIVTIVASLFITSSTNSAENEHSSAIAELESRGFTDVRPMGDGAYTVGIGDCRFGVNPNEYDDWTIVVEHNGEAVWNETANLELILDYDSVTTCLGD